MSLANVQRTCLCLSILVACLESMKMTANEDLYFLLILVDGFLPIRTALA